MKQQLVTEYEIYNNDSELNQQDLTLLTAARNNTSLAYAPYSKFEVAAVALLSNGDLIMGANQENAAYPVGICAERTLLSAISTQHPKHSAIAIAISYNNLQGQSMHPISPCGICRQTLLEYEQRWQHPIKLILSGQTGPIIVIKSTKDIMPFSFGAEDMGK
jgi:cytidine deaminase